MIMAANYIIFALKCNAENYYAIVIFVMNDGAPAISLPYKTRPASSFGSGAAASSAASA